MPELKTSLAMAPGGSGKDAPGRVGKGKAGRDFALLLEVRPQRADRQHAATRAQNGSAGGIADEPRLRSPAAIDRFDRARHDETGTAESYGPLVVPASPRPAGDTVFHVDPRDGARSGEPSAETGADVREETAHRAGRPDDARGAATGDALGIQAPGGRAEGARSGTSMTSDRPTDDTVSDPQPEPPRSGASHAKPGGGHAPAKTETAPAGSPAPSISDTASGAPAPAKTETAPATSPVTGRSDTAPARSPAPETGAGPEPAHATATDRRLETTHAPPSRIEPPVRALRTSPGQPHEQQPFAAAAFLRGRIEAAAAGPAASPVAVSSRVSERVTTLSQIIVARAVAARISDKLAQNGSIPTSVAEAAASRETPAASRSASPQDVVIRASSREKDGAETMRAIVETAPPRDRFEPPAMSNTAVSPPVTPGVPVAQQVVPALVLAAIPPAQKLATVADRTRLEAGPATVHSLEIQLKPAELGAVSARLSVAGAQLTVEIDVERQDVQVQIERDRETIVKALRGLGFEVEQVTVTLSAGTGHGAREGMASSQGVNPGPQAGERGGTEAGSGGGRGTGDNPSASREGGRHENGPGGDRPAGADRGGSLYI